MSKHRSKLQEYLISFCSGMWRPELGKPSSLSVRTCNQPQHGARANRLCKTVVSNGENTSLWRESEPWDSVGAEEEQREELSAPKTCLCLHCSSSGVPPTRACPHGSSHSWDTPAPLPAGTAAEGAPASGDPSQLRSQQRPACAWSKCLGHGQTSPSVSHEVPWCAQSQPWQDCAALAHHAVTARQAFCRPGCLLPAFCLDSICCGVSFCCF